MHTNAATYRIPYYLRQKPATKRLRKQKPLLPTIYTHSATVKSSEHTNTLSELKSRVT